MNAMMDVVQSMHTDRTHKGAVSFQKRKCYLNKYGCQAAIFENGFGTLTNILYVLMDFVQIMDTDRTHKVGFISKMWSLFMGLYESLNNNALEKYLEMWFWYLFQREIGTVII